MTCATSLRRPWDTSRILSEACLKLDLLVDHDLVVANLDPFGLGLGFGFGGRFGNRRVALHGESRAVAEDGRATARRDDDQARDREAQSSREGSLCHVLFPVRSGDGCDHRRARTPVIAPTCAFPRIHASLSWIRAATGLWPAALWPKRS